LPRIADVKVNLGLSEGILGLVLLALPLGTFTALSVAGPLIKRVSPAQALLFSLTAWSFAFVLPAAAGTAVVLALSLAVCGLVMGILEVASNLEADSIEQRIEKRIMSQCHGYWSLGAMTGALLGGPVFAGNGVSVLHQFFILCPIAVIASVIVTRLLAQSSKAHQATIEVTPAQSKKRSKPSLAVLMLCLTPLGIMAIEGSFMDWSAVFMREQMQTDSSIAGYTFAMFAAVMASVRLAGDWLGERFGDALMVRLSGIAATLGIVLFATATHVPIALIGAALAGAGCAIVYPLTMSAVARADEKNREDNVAYLSIAAFSVMMISPPVIGWIAEFSSLRIGLLCLVPGSIATIVLAGRLTTR